MHRVCALDSSQSGRLTNSTKSIQHSSLIFNSGATMKCSTNAFVKVTVIAALSMSAVQSYAEEQDAITPYRPTASSPSVLSAEGQLEFELGGLRSKSEGQSRDSLPYLFKLALNKDWAVLVGGEAYVSAPDGTSKIRGMGDTTVTLKRALPIDEQTAFGVELGVKQPTAKTGIGSDKRDVVLNGIFSKDFGAIHMDANLNVTHIGGVTSPESATQTGTSASFSTAYNDKLSLAAEIAAARRSGTSNTAQVLFAAAYSPTKRLTFDVGIAKGLNSATQDWALFAGVVVPVAKLW
jgi:hypothetical protein